MFGHPVDREQPAAGQESVWDYPRPPSMEQTARHIVVVVADRIIADTTLSWRVCETSHPPVYYIPRTDIAPEVLIPGRGTSVCEYKGVATFWSVVVDDRIVNEAAWSYERPTSAYVDMTGAVAFYPGRVDEARVDGELVQAQAGGFYGGWITDEIVGPFKGEPGTSGW